jgi:hypothetical protein
MKVVDKQYDLAEVNLVPDTEARSARAVVESLLLNLY